MIRSTFSFQSGEWLGDVAPTLLDAGTRQRLIEAKGRALARRGGGGNFGKGMEWNLAVQ